jgi:hypothetical protein
MTKEGISFTKHPTVQISSPFAMMPQESGVCTIERVTLLQAG